MVAFYFIRLKLTLNVVILKVSSNVDDSMIVRYAPGIHR